MKEFDMILRIIGDDGSIEGTGRHAISQAPEFGAEWEDAARVQDEYEDKLEAKDRIITGCKEQLQALTTGGIELEKRFATQTHTITLPLEQGIGIRGCWKSLTWENKKLKEDTAEGLRKYEEEWKVWAEKGAQVKVKVKAGKAMSSERKRWQAKGKALSVKTVTIATQTDHIGEAKAIEVDDSTQTEVLLEELERRWSRRERGKGRGEPRTVKIQ